MALTGSVAPNGKQILLALEIWRDDVNAKGGLLGRPVELVYYDDQSNPSNVPGIYTKLISVDKVNLLLGPYATNMAAAAMPAIMQNNKTTITMLAIGVNSHFNYPKYFSMVPVGPRAGVLARFFELAAAQSRSRKRWRSRRRCRIRQDRVRWRARKRQGRGFDIIYDKTYPPNTTDFSGVVRSIQASNADVVFVAAYPPDTVGIVSAAHEVRLAPKMFGGTMIGLLVTPIKMRLGPLMDGIVTMESFVPSFDFPGLKDVLAKYRVKAAGEKIDPFGYGFVPFAYAAGQVLADAVTATKGFDHDKLADYIHGHKFSTVAGEIAYNKNGDWTEPRTVFTQFQNVTPNDLEQFSKTDHQVIVWPDKYKTGNFVYPYTDTAKK